MIRAFVIRGDFDDADYVELVALIRAIDDRHPERLYEITAVDPERSALDSAKVVMDALPKVDGRQTEGPVILTPAGDDDTREPGYYWVRCYENEKPVIARWDEDKWFVPCRWWGEVECIGLASALEA
jgi:hypothetical protein